MLRFPLIKVRDKGQIESPELIVGSNHHHVLLIQQDGGIQFHNIQCCDGTGEYGDYEFVRGTGLWENQIDMVDIFQLLEVVCENENIKENGLFEEYQNAVGLLKNILDKSNSINKEKMEEMIKSCVANIREKNLL